MSNKPTVGSLFAGIGGIDYAFEAAGFQSVWQVEIADYPRAILAKHFPDATQHRDIFECHHLPHVDVITAGFPCQPFSAAGKRQGEKDERCLIPEMQRVIQEVQPYVVFLENVPGFASIANGDTFKQLLRALAEMGYDAQWGHLRASDAGAPHQRERWFCVAYRSNEWAYRGKCIAGYDAARGSLRGKSSGNRSNGDVFNVAQRCAHAVNARSQRRAERHAATSSGGIGQFAGRLNPRGRSRTLKSRLGGNAHGLPAGLDRHIFPAPPGQPQHAVEPPRVQARTPNQTARLKALGNAVVPQVVYPVALAIHEWLMAEVRKRRREHPRLAARIPRPAIIPARQAH